MKKEKKSNSSFARKHSSIGVKLACSAFAASLVRSVDRSNRERERETARKKMREQDREHR